MTEAFLTGVAFLALFLVLLHFITKVDEAGMWAQLAVAAFSGGWRVAVLCAIFWAITK